MNKFAKLMDWGRVSLKQACCKANLLSSTSYLGTQKILCVKIVTVFKLKGNPFLKFAAASSSGSSSSGVSSGHEVTLTP